MKVAVLGTGFGARHAELLAKRKEVESIILWGRKEGKLRELKEKLHVETTEDMEEIWSDGTIGLVDVCLPNHLHREAAIKALRAGKHVFVETPVAESLADAEAILKTAEQCGKRVFVDLFLRFERPYEYLRQLVQGGRLGALKELLVKRETPPWWGNLDGAHIGMNLMMHDVDFVTRLLGEPEGIFASSMDVREQQSIAMPQAHPFSVGYEAILEQGTVRYYEDGYADGTTDTRLELFCGEKREEVPLRQVNCYEAAIEHVLQCIRDDRASCLDVREAIRTLRTVLRMNRALTFGREVQGNELD